MCKRILINIINNQIILNFIGVLFLFGCSRAPEHHEFSFYMQHQDEAIKVVSYCRAQGGDYVQLLMKNKNCLNAELSVEQTKRGEFFAELKRKRAASN